ncbi:NACHT domain-containing protein, partial [Rickettsiales endosymbiont of Peranema trichophorum]|uniref:NACHT domain-containing protein n=1 Tax=Rickettsiales endosymbiont of Peranema trichophorum TaxID=2486577 RepID=UPI0010232A44
MPVNFHSQSDQVVSTATHPLSEKLKSFYKAHDVLPKLIEDDHLPIQKIKDYYVKLEIMLNAESDRETIEVANIFDAVEDQKATERVLITAGAGMGKTTLLHYIAYQWARSQLFCKRFDYVFRVKLKTLTSSDYQPDDVAPLVELIYQDMMRQCTDLEDSGVQLERISRQELRSVLEDKELSSKTLLLLDGYDEVVHLTEEHKLRLVLKDVFKYENVLLTSRPNALSDRMLANFGRRIEGKGLEESRVIEYINKYFDYQSEVGGVEQNGVRHKLLELYRSNQSLRAALKIPINTVIVCLMSGDPDVMGLVGIEFNLGGLYEGMVAWLSKRYLHKTVGGGLCDTGEAEEAQKVVLSILERLSYESFKNDKLVVEGRELEWIVGNVKEQSPISIRGMYQYGLLRSDSIGVREYSAQEWHKKQYEFVHLSFQEWLVAHCLKGKLLEEGAEGQEATEFISNHRNEPKCLMMLKFLSGLVANERSDRAELLVIRFWDAVLCNVDGVLECDGVARVKLLMHILGQAKVQGLVDARIPNLDRIVELIDEEVCGNVFEWGEEICSSSYLSDEMKRRLIKPLADWKGQDDRDLKVSLDVIEQTLDKLIGEGGRILEACHILLCSDGDLQIKKRAIKVSAGAIGVLGSNANSGTVLDVIEKIVSYVNDHRLNKEISSTLVEISRVDRLYSEKILVEVIGAARVWDYTGRKIAVEVIEGVTLWINIEVKVRAIKELVAILKERSISGFVTAGICSIASTGGEVVKTEALRVLSPLLENENEYVRISAMEVVFKIMSARDIRIGVKLEVLQYMVTLLNDESDYIRLCAVVGIGEIYSGEDIPIATKVDIVRSLIPVLDDGCASSAAMQVISKISSVVNVLTEVQLEVSRALMDVLRNGNCRCRESAVGIIGRIGVVCNIPISVRVSIIQALLTLLEESEASMRNSVAEVVWKVSSGQDVPPMIKLAVIRGFIPLLKDENECTKVHAVLGIGEMASGEDIPVGVRIRALNMLIPLLKDVNTGCHRAVVITIGRIGSISDVPVSVRVKAIRALIAIIKERGTYVVEATWKVIMGGDVPVAVKLEVIQGLIPLLQNENEYTRMYAMLEIGEIVAGEDIPMGVQVDVVYSLISFLKDVFANDLAVEIMVKIVKESNISMGVRVEIVNSLVDVLRYNDRRSHKLALEAIMKIGSGENVSAEVKVKTLKLLIELLRECDSTLSAHITDRIMLLVLEECIPIEMNVEVVRVLISFLDVKHGSVCWSGVEVICGIAAAGKMPLEVKFEAIRALALVGSGCDDNSWYVKKVIDSIIESVESVNELLELRTKELVKMDVVENSIIRRLASMLSNGSVLKGDIRILIPMLKIIESDLEDVTTDRNVVIEKAKESLYAIVMPEYISAATTMVLQEGIGNILALSSESKNFVRRLMYEVLGDGRIEGNEIELVEQCVEYNVATISKDCDGVVVDGLLYRINDGVSQCELRNIVQRVHDRKVDLVVQCDRDGFGNDKVVVKDEIQRVVKSGVGIKEQRLVLGTLRDGINLNNDVSARYWYNLEDGIKVLLSIREKQLSYNMVNIPEEGYQAYMETKERIFVSAPYHTCDLEDNLVYDIKIITGTHEVQELNQEWVHRPEMMVISLLHGLHWKCLKMNIDYDSKSINVLYDDPYGKEIDDVLDSRITKAVKEGGKLLFGGRVRTVTLDSKEVDQQGLSLGNGYDCGPIVFSNIRNYVSNRDYTIRSVEKIGHRGQVLEMRERDMSDYGEVSDVLIDEQLKVIREKIKSGLAKKAQWESVVEGLPGHDLVPEVVEMLLIMLEEKHKAEGRVEEQYTAEDVLEMYGLLFGTNTEVYIVRQSYGSNAQKLIASSLGMDLLYAAHEVGGSILHDALLDVMYEEEQALALLSRAREIGSRELVLEIMGAVEASRDIDILVIPYIPESSLALISVEGEQGQVASAIGRDYMNAGQRSMISRVIDAVMNRLNNKLDF